MTCRAPAATPSPTATIRPSLIATSTLRFALRLYDGSANY